MKLRTRVALGSRMQESAIMPVIWLQFRGFAVSKCIRQRQRSGMGVVLNKCHFGIVYVAALNWDWIIHQRRQIVTKVGGSLCSSSITGGHWHSTRVTHHTFNKYLTIMKSHDHKAQLILPAWCLQGNDCWTVTSHECGWIYSVIQQVSDLGWVDVYLDVPVILPSCFAHSAFLSSA